MPGPCCSPWPPASVLRASWPSTYPADDGGGDAGSVAVPTETQARGQDPHWRRQGHHSHAGHRDFRNPGRYRERSSQTAGLTMVARAIQAGYDAGRTHVQTAAVTAAVPAPDVGAGPAHHRTAGCASRSSACPGPVAEPHPPSARSPRATCRTHAGTASDALSGLCKRFSSVSPAIFAGSGSFTGCS